MVSSKDLNFRLDASYHNPAVRKIVDQLEDANFSIEKVGEVTDRVYIPPRFKRVYVEKEYGIPFLQGSHVPLLKPFDLQYLSKKAIKDIERWIIHDNWVLVTCSGTIGRTMITPSHWDGWSATQHILRSICSENSDVHSGYLATFLKTP